MLPSIFGENLFDDFFTDPFGMMVMPQRHDPLYGKHSKNLMKTDVRETADSYTSYNRMVVLLFYLFHLPLVRPRSCHRRLVFQTQIWTAALDFTALKCISRKILPSCERVIFRKKR